MCAALLHMDRASDAELTAAIAGKLKKFGKLEAMPPPTRELVAAAMQELDRRTAAQNARGA